MAGKIKGSKLYNIIKKRKLKTGDPLGFLLDIIHFKMKKNIFYVNLAKMLIILYLQTFNVIGIIYILRDETGDFLRQYVTVIVCQQIGITSYILHMYYTPNLMNLSKTIEEYFLPLNITGQEVHEQILRECTFVKRYSQMLLALLLCMFGMLLPVVGDEEEIEFTVMFIKKHITIWPSLFLVLYYTCIISLGYSVTSVCVACLYLVLHLKFQCQLLAQYLKQVSNGYNPDIAKQLYQKVVYEKLKSFVEAHSRITKGSAMFLNIGKWAVLGAAIAASIFNAAIIYFVLMNVSPPSNIRCGLALMMTVLITYIFATSGQALQNESVKLYDTACNCDWEHWNVRNRKTLLMIIINTRKVMKLTSFGILDLGYEIALRILKLTYSMVLLFLNAK